MKNALSILLALASATVQAQATRNEAMISTDAAIEVARAALAQCRKDHANASVSVVDAAGRLKVQLRDDGARPHTAEHSFRKAYTAATYAMPSAEYGKRAAEAKGVAIGPQLLPNITSAAGGVPIRSGDTVIGAVGVSGTPAASGGGEHDAKCAQAGIDRVAEELKR